MSVTPNLPTLTTSFGQKPIASGVATKIARLSGLIDANPNGGFRILFVVSMADGAGAQQLSSIVQLTASQLGATLAANATQYGTTQSGTDAGSLSAAFSVDTSVLGQADLLITLTSSSLAAASCTLGMQLEGRNRYGLSIGFL